MFRANQIIQDKAQFENNGLFLVESCNAGLDYLVSFLRTKREATICGVTSFTKGQPFAARRALHMIASRFAEQVNISLGEY